MEHAYIQFVLQGGPMITLSAPAKQDVWPNADKWLVLYESKWRRVHVQVNRLYIVYLGEKLTVQIEGV